MQLLAGAGGEAGLDLRLRRDSSPAYERGQGEIVAELERFVRRLPGREDLARGALQAAAKVAVHGGCGRRERAAGEVERVAKEDRADEEHLGGREILLDGARRLAALAGGIRELALGRSARTLGGCQRAAGGIGFAPPRECREGPAPPSRLRDARRVAWFLRRDRRVATRGPPPPLRPRPRALPEARAREAFENAPPCGARLPRRGDSLPKGGNPERPS